MLLKPDVEHDGSCMTFSQTLNEPCMHPTVSFATVGLVQTPGAPLLKITHSGSDFVLSWPDPSTGFKLQSTPTLVPSNWTDVSQPVVVLGSDKTVTVPVAGQNQFYRLFQ